MANRKIGCVRLAGLFLLLISAAAVAGPAEDIARINEDIAVLQARLKKLEVEANIAAKHAEIERLQPTGRNDMPTVRSVDGYDGKMTATVVFAGRGASIVGVGDVLPNGFSVASISVNRVTLKKGKQVEVLVIGHDPAKAEVSTTAPQTANAVPGGPLSAPPLGMPTGGNR